MFEEMVSYCLGPGYSHVLGNIQFEPRHGEDSLHVMHSEAAGESGYYKNIS